MSPRQPASNESFLEAASGSRAVEGKLFEQEDVVDGDVSGLQFEQCEFRDCVFEDTKIRDSTFIGCRFTKCRFRSARLSRVNFSGPREEDGCIWNYCDLAEAGFDECNLSMNTVSRSEAYLASFNKCAGMGLRFEADVHRWVSKKLVIGGAKFTECRLQYAIFHELDLSRSEFVKCDLRDASFRRSNLSDCSFMGSALSNTEFSAATLDRATIAYANFDRFNLADLQSYDGLVVSREQADNILAAPGMVVVT